MRTLLLLLLLWQPGQALAHAALLDATPEDGAALEAPPAAVRLRFDEPVGLIALTLAGPQGTAALEGTVQNDVLSARLPPALPQGTYLLSWRVTSADSHPVAGTIAFGIGQPPAPHAAPAPQRWLAPSMALRAAFLAALLVAAGGALFRLVAEPPSLRPLAWVSWLGVVLAAAQIGLRGALLADAPTLLDPDIWTLGAHTTLAASLAVSAAGLAACALATRTRRPWPGAAAALLALAALPLSGHAGTAEPRWLTSPALLLHALGAAFWIGALWPLLALLRNDGLAAIRRFSAAAVPAVAMLLLSGLVLAAVQLGSLAALASEYGRALLLKLAAVAALLAFAAWNKWRLTPRAAAAPLRTSIRVELALAAAVLSATAVLGLNPPPRAAATSLPRPDRAAWTTAGGIPATIALAPGRPGRNRFTVTIGTPRPPREVTLELRQPRAGVAAIRRPMRLEAGEWTYEGPELALPGRWTIRADALVTEFDQTSFTIEMDIP